MAWKLPSMTGAPGAGLAWSRPLAWSVDDAEEVEDMFKMLLPRTILGPTTAGVPRFPVDCSPLVVNLERLRTGRAP